MKLSPSIAALLLSLPLLITACSSPSGDPSTKAEPGVATEATGEKSDPEDKAEIAVEGSEPAATEAETDTPSKAAPARKEPGAGPMPEKFAGIHQVLKSATLKKEPGNMAYNNHAEPTVALRWFARYGTEAQVRIFALRALGLYPTPENIAVLVEVAMNKTEPPLVRAGALRGLGRYDLEQESLAKAKKFIFEVVAGKDLVLAAAATDAMHGMPTARPILLELTSNPSTPASLKAAAERALGPQVE